MLQNLLVSAGDTVTVQQFVVPRSGFEIALLTAEVGDAVAPQRFGGLATRQPRHVCRPTLLFAGGFRQPNRL